MTDKPTTKPAVFTIPAHRAFADALAAGLLAQYGKDRMELARGIILVPTNRAARSIGEAFVRRAETGLLLPRLVPVGDPDLGETLGNALEPIGEGADIPPAMPAMERQMILARMVQDARAAAGQPVDAGEAMRLAMALGQTLDQLLIEKVGPERIRALDISGELSDHWNKSLELFNIIIDRWPRELAVRCMIDMAERRNRLLGHVAERWRMEPPGGFVIAAGITTPAPAVAGLLYRIARLERGQVVLPDLDLHMDPEEWASIGPFEPDPVTGHRRRAIETHPQFVLKLLLDRMGVHRDEVALWRWGGGHDARAVRSRNISNAMLPPRLTVKWRDLQTTDRNLAGVRALEAATPAEEAQAVAIALREALETPGRTAALVTPDRGLATRVSAHLRRWGIEADDSAGRPLSQLPPGTLLLALAEAAAERFAPVPLLTLLKHPLVMAGEGRLGWLEQVRRLDRMLRGPRPPAGLAGVDQLLTSMERQSGQSRGLSPQAEREEEGNSSLRRNDVHSWWASVRPILLPLEIAFSTATSLPQQLAALREAAGALTGEAVWAGHQGHQAAEAFGELEAAAHEGPREADPRSFVFLLEQVLAGAAVRPPQGGHPRLSILGLLEARLQQADLMILSGLNEGSWPALSSPDPWLAPRIRHELGLPSLERRIGLAAHDLANALGAPQVLITRARREASGPAIASRFWLRLKAMAGPQWREAKEYRHYALKIDEPDGHFPERQPAPCPPAALRPRDIAVTDVDRLKADPYSFYARKMLGLSALDPVDAEPSAAWRGTAVHEVLERWAKEDSWDPAKLSGRALEMLSGTDAHPMMRALWQPRLMQAIGWIARQVAEDMAAGRQPLLAEKWGRLRIADVMLSGKADRIDLLPDGSLAIIDYKTGKPPSGKQVAAGYSMQLGLLGLIAEHGDFDGLAKGRKAATFEYWSLGRDQKSDSFGYRQSPVDPQGARGKIVTDEFTDVAAAHFVEAVETWLTGNAPFTAKLHPEIPTYGDYDQLMRLEEWYGRGKADV